MTYTRWLVSSALLPTGPLLMPSYRYAPHGQMPRLLIEVRGARAESAIPGIREAIASYPWPNTYRAWHGPNSNTFTARVLGHVGLDEPWPMPRTP